MNSRNIDCARERRTCATLRYVCVRERERKRLRTFSPIIREDCQTGRVIAVLFRFANKKHTASNDYCLPASLSENEKRRIKSETAAQVQEKSIQKLLILHIFPPSIYTTQNTHTHTEIISPPDLTF